MSKANDWLSAIQQTQDEIEVASAHLEVLRSKPLRCDDVSGYVIAHLTATGDIWVRPEGIPAAYRGKFVRWILDTFAEPEQLTIREVESAGTV